MEFKEFYEKTKRCSILYKDTSPEKRDIFFKEFYDDINRQLSSSNTCEEWELVSILHFNPTIIKLAYSMYNNFEEIWILRLNNKFIGFSLTKSSEYIGFYTQNIIKEIMEEERNRFEARAKQLEEMLDHLDGDNTDDIEETVKKYREDY